MPSSLSPKFLPETIYQNCLGWTRFSHKKHLIISSFRYWIVLWLEIWGCVRWHFSVPFIRSNFWKQTNDNYLKTFPAQPAAEARNERSVHGDESTSTFREKSSARKSSLQEGRVVSTGRHPWQETCLLLHPQEEGDLLGTGWARLPWHPPEGHGRVRGRVPGAHPHKGGCCLHVGRRAHRLRRCCTDGRQDTFLTLWSKAKWVTMGDAQSFFWRWFCFLCQIFQISNCFIDINCLSANCWYPLSLALAIELHSTCHHKAEVSIFLFPIETLRE